MGKYRKKPVVIDAIQFFNGDGKSTLSDCVSFTNNLAWYNDRVEGLVIPTLEGDMVAKDGDFIIKGIKGEFYPCKEDIFNQTYEEVSD